MDPSYVDGVSDTLRRVTVHLAGPRGWSEADLALPAGCPLGVLMPAMVEAVAGATPAQPLRWYASRLAGDRLDGALTLDEQGVADGELIVVSSARPVAAQRVHGDTAAAVLAVAEHRTVETCRVAPWVGLLGCVAAASALMWPGSPSTVLHFWVAAALSAVAAAAALARCGSGAEPAGSAAVVFAACAGRLAVPEAPWPATLLLTASAVLVMSTLVLRTACRSSTLVAALLTASACVITVAAVCTVTTPPVPAAGAALTVLAVAGLSLAPKLAVTLAGIGPAHPAVDDAATTEVHRLFTGLVAGLAGTAAAGAALAAVGSTVGSEAAAVSRPAAVLFAADVGALLMLRHRVHVDPRRRTALVLAGATGCAAACWAAVLTAPGAAPWVAAAAGAAGIAAAGLPRLGPVTNPVLRQSVQVLEYALLAAVVPLAVWVLGGYGLVRQLGLS